MSRVVLLLRSFCVMMGECGLGAELLCCTICEGVSNEENP